ncbi:MAG: HD domain-containing protein [Lachnospiraceae bacterium]|nr:HD domain-containing protein [Lachnospiraceae bacterium]
MDSKRFEQQKAFILEADKEKNILRQTHLSGHGRRENDAEHAWHMAMMAYLLKEYSNEPIDIARTMIMCLIHDIVEIDAGDTYAYDEEGKKTQRKREEVAAERIFGLLPKDQREELRGIFEEFEAAETKEAKFARAMDNLQPLLLNDSNGGEDWRNHKVSYRQVRNRQDTTERGSKDLYRITREILDRNLEKGNLQK